MAASAIHPAAAVLLGRDVRRPLILVGVTHSQTCLVLKSRLRALRVAGFQVIVVASPGELLEKTAEDAGVEAVAIPMRREIAFLADLIALVRLWRLIGKCNPDMVEFSTPKAGLLGSLAAWLRGVPLRVYLLRGLRLETSGGLKRRILLAAERLAAACAHLVLCNSESLRAEALTLRIASGEKLQVFGDGSSGGVDVRRFSPGPENVRVGLGFSREDRVIGFVGRLTRDKGVPELIEAFDAVLQAEPKARLLLVGWFDDAEDALAPAVRARIVSHPRIRLTGFVHDTAPYYRALDVMVLPTWREGFPNVVLEAAATGVPVIATDATGSRDSVVPEVTGLLIPPGSPEAISQALLRLLEDPELRSEMGRAARLRVLARYTDERVLGLATGFYAEMLSRAVEPIPIPSLYADLTLRSF
ncbi:MAG TPA: glycosyltransferase family 4 protein [Terracidiphilus sp.]|jgi:glycosyltransferase involved in cell wall biosynthesis